MNTEIVITIVTLGVLVGCAALLSLHPEGRSGGYFFLLGLAFQFIVATCASVVQAVCMGFGLLGVSLSDKGQLLVLPFIGVPFNLGGFSVARVFESTIGSVESIFGERTSTVMSNLPYYLILLSVQVLIVAIVIGWRARRKQSLKDWLCLSIGALLLVNALVNIKWAWWGS